MGDPSVEPRLSGAFVWDEVLFMARKESLDGGMTESDRRPGRYESNKSPGEMVGRDEE